MIRLFAGNVDKTQPSRSPYASIRDNVQGEDPSVLNGMPSTGIRSPVPGKHA